MAFHDELLQQAVHLVHKEPKRPRQASLRRAVSTAYYALFHLLISESVANWSRPSLRNRLSRTFDHQLMKSVSRRFAGIPFTGVNPKVVASLRIVATAFYDLQEQRHIADYDNATVWSPAEAQKLVSQAERAFATWKTIRNEDIDQEYLVSLLIKSR
jgi:uncharacterized protein (UPF0332 family)